MPVPLQRLAGPLIQIQTKGLHTRALSARPRRYFHQTTVASYPRKRSFFTSNQLWNAAQANGDGDGNGNGSSGLTADASDSQVFDTPLPQSQSPTPKASILPPKRKPVRTSASKAARLGKMHKQPKRPTPPSAPAESTPAATKTDYRKTIYAQCVAREFDMEHARDILSVIGFEIDPDGTGVDPLSVLHARSINNGDVFVFPSGTIVSWSMPYEGLHKLATKTLKDAATSPHLDNQEIEELEFAMDDSRDTSHLKGDVVVLGTNNEALDITMAKVAFSSGLARSPKLAVLEANLIDYFQTHKDLDEQLEKGQYAKLSSRVVLKRTSELLSIRSQLNHYSDITDQLPDIFWDSESSLEEYYNQISNAFDVRQRISMLNRNIDYAHENVSVLREMTSEQHGTRLEWIIILLISVEVLFELRRVYKEEWGDKEDRSVHGEA